MAAKNWLKQANTPKPGAELESGKSLRWQGARYKHGEVGTTPQSKIQNTTFIFPATGGRGVKKP